jgi:hypothetical protein
MGFGLVHVDPLHHAPPDFNQLSRLTKHRLSANLTPLLLLAIGYLLLATPQQHPKSDQWHPAEAGPEVLSAAAGLTLITQVESAGQTHVLLLDD